MSGVGEQLKRIRESQGLTQEEIGERLGFAGATIGRYENGHRQMRADELPRFAAAVISRQTVAPFTTLPPTME